MRCGFEVPEDTFVEMPLAVCVVPERALANWKSVQLALALGESEGESGFVVGRMSPAVFLRSRFDCPHPGLRIQKTKRCCQFLLPDLFNDFGAQMGAIESRSLEASLHLPTLSPPRTPPRSEIKRFLGP